MIDVAVLRAMAAAGATVEMILAAIEADQKSQVERLQERRAKDAERQRRNRSVRNGHADSYGSSDAVCDPPAHILPPKKESSEPKKALRLRAGPIPDDFALSEADRDHAEANGWKSDKIASEFLRFCDHARANGRKQVDWHAAWRNWVTSPFQKSQAPPVNGHEPRAGSREDTRERTVNALRKLDLFVASHSDDDGRGRDPDQENAGRVRLGKSS